MIERDLPRIVWRKSSRSGGTGGNCVEVARIDAARLVRDSKNPSGGTLALDGYEWTTLVTKIKRGHHDL
jgi:hypothetical protein